MANVNLSAFLTEVSHLIPGCPDPTAISAVRNAAIEFCTATNQWQETQDEVAVTSTDFPYDLVGIAGAKVTRVLSVSVDGRNVTPISMDELDAREYSWRTRTSAVPSRFYHPNPDQISLFPLPSQSVDLIMRVAYAPTRTAATIDGFLHDNYLEEIAAGALSRLLSVPERPWSNAVLGEYYNNIFERAIALAAADANQSFGRASLIMQAPRFA